ncbi:MAG: homoserine dehydrogenase [Planctomycetota bacterium]
MSENITRIGLVGFGTVGSGVARLILEESKSIAARTGVRLELARVVDVDTTSARSVELPAGLLSNDLEGLLKDDSIAIAVELVGGTTAAQDIMLKMLRARKHVVTANKALLAEHGDELYKTALENNRCIAFEASCAGGIPIISAIRTGLSANRIEAMYGILNGTCNFILSNMTKNNADFSETLKLAQQRGYAESNPALDINGSDSAHKLAILASVCFGYRINFKDIYVEGIENISLEDIRYGKEMGYILKLLAVAERDRQDRISLRVHPSFISRDNPLARVDGAFNAVSIFGNAVGQTMYYGRGAGMMPTASAVVADIIEAALGNSQRLFVNSTARSQRQQAKMESIDNVTCRFYIRAMMKDQPGVVASYGKIFGDNNISLSGVLQHEGSGPDNTVPVVITTHTTEQRRITAALEDMKSLDVISGRPICIRILDIPEDKD